MAAFNFPNSPSTNDLHTENSVTWKWDGTVWKRQGVAGAQGAAGAQGHQGVQGAANATTINNNANNRVITGSGSANTLEAESTLLWSGNALSAYRDNATTYGPGIVAHHQRGTISSPSVSQTNDTLLNIVAKGYDGDEYHDAARIDFVSGGGTPGNNDMPGSIHFKTTDDGQSSSTTRVSIQQNGNLLLDSSCSLVIHDGILHNGDTDTQIRFPANDTFAVNTAGSERLRIDASGDIGLGIANPNLSGYGSPVVSIGHNSSNNYSVLELTGNKTSNTGTNAPISTIVGYNVGGASRIASINFCRYNANNNGAITFNTYSSGVEGERLVITAAGLMGLGMTPTRMFEVKDSTNANRIMNIRGTGTSGAFLAFLDANTTDDSKCRIGSVGGNSIGMRGDAHYFQNGAGTNRMVIDSSGAVTKPLQPSFMARHSAGITLNYGGQNHTYNTEMWDLNSDYSTSTGKFVAPVSGYYYMNHTIAVSGNNSGCLEAKLAINDTEVLRSYLYYEGGQAGGTSIACGVRYMAANDELRPTTHWSGSSGTGTHNGNSNNPICFFQAHLVH